MNLPGSFARRLGPAGVLVLLLVLVTGAGCGDGGGGASRADGTVSLASDGAPAASRRDAGSGVDGAQADAGGRPDAGGPRPTPGADGGPAARPPLTFVSIPQGLPGVTALVDARITSLAGGAGAVFAGSAGGLSISRDDGLRFETRTVADGLETNEVEGLVVHRERVYAHGHGGLFASLDGGKTWKVLASGLERGPNRLLNVSRFAVAGERLIIGNVFGSLAISPDHGARWKSIDNDQYEADKVWFDKTPRAILYAHDRVLVATNSGLNVSVDDGMTFQLTASEPGSPLREVNALAADADRIYAATARGLLVQKKGTDAWATKTIADGLPDDGVQGLFFEGGRLFLRCASALASSEDGGETFRVWAITDHAKIAQLAVTGAKLFATFKGTSGIFFSPDSGKTWVPRGKPAGFPDLVDRGSGHDVQAIAAGGGGAVVLTRGGIVRYEDEGRARRTVPPERHRHPGDFLARGGRTLYTGIGIWSELYASDDGGETWTSRTTGGPGMNATAAAGDGFSFVSRKVPDLRISTDRGVTFSRTVPFDALGCARSDSSQSHLLAAEPGLLAFACDGILQTSPDEGASFRRYDVGKARVTALAVADGRIIAATSERAILVSTDGGRTFAPVPPPPFVASFLAASGDQVAVGSNSAQVAYSADAGKSWQALGPSAGLGNSFVRALAFDGPRLWVGTAGGLFLGRPAAP